jgi:hypothetical protein
MKVKAFLEVLRPYAVVIAAHGSEHLATQMNALRNVWTSAMSWNVKDLLHRAWPKECLPEADETSVRDFREALVRLQDVLKTIAKQDLITDLSAVIAALEPHDREDLASFVEACRLALEAAQTTKGKRKASKKATSQPVNEQRVTEIVQQLKNSYKDAEHFGPIYERLSRDESVTAPDMAAVATSFAYETSPSTKRTESLRRIWLVHESYTTSAAKSKFSAGK